MSPATSSHGASWRDPDGFLFKHRGRLYRQVNHSGAADYRLLMKSGLYDELTRDGLLIAHEEVKLPDIANDQADCFLRPTVVPLISYPYEWSFSQLKDAALLTLDIQARALKHGLSLKDASAFNVQFMNGRPIFIDTLSFEKYPAGKPWVAYRQFCQHFLAPLALMSQQDIRLSELFRTNLDGIPLDLAARLLPFKSRLSPALLIHIFLHARSQQRHNSRQVDVSRYRFSELALAGLIDNLRGAVQRLRWQPGGTEWADYYTDTNYTASSRDAKAELVSEYIKHSAPRQVWDLGANDGTYSVLAAREGIPTVALDIDPAAIEQGYLKTKQRGVTNLQLLVMDLTNPSPSLGWANNERSSLTDRGPTDLALALALIHHLSIGNNLPFDRVADWLSTICQQLIIEFVPKTDSQVKRLLVSREDVFTDYDQAHFEAAFKEKFKIERQQPISGTKRTLYLMTKLAI